MPQRLGAAYEAELRLILADQKRLERVYDLAFLAQDLQDQLNQILEVTRNMLHAPHAAINLIYEREIIILASSGDQALGESAVTPGTSVPVDQTFCQYVVKETEPLLIEDSLTHPLVCASIWANDVRSYLGVPLTINGYTVGSLCVTSGLPKQWTSAHITLLAQCAALVQALIERGTHEPGAREDPSGQPGQEEADCPPVG